MPKRSRATQALGPRAYRSRPSRRVERLLWLAVGAVLAIIAIRLGYMIGFEDRPGPFLALTEKERVGQSFALGSSLEVDGSILELSDATFRLRMPSPVEPGALWTGSLRFSALVTDAGPDDALIVILPQGAEVGSWASSADAFMPSLDPALVLRVDADYMAGHGPDQQGPPTRSATMQTVAAVIKREEAFAKQGGGWLARRCHCSKTLITVNGGYGGGVRWPVEA
jgi:hypothetical protein